jgi:siroheme synthase-like protein
VSTSSFRAFPVFPLFLRLEDRAVLVVGGGTIATRKVHDLLEVGARVRVVALGASAELRALARADRIALVERAFVPGDVEGAWLVVSATNDSSVNRAVSEAASRARTFVCAIDDPAAGSAFFASVVNRPPFLIAISSQGELPGLTRLVREVIESVLPDTHWVGVARELRRAWKAEGKSMSDRFPELVRRIASSTRDRAG